MKSSVFVSARKKIWLIDKSHISFQLYCAAPVQFQSLLLLLCPLDVNVVLLLRQPGLKRQLFVSVHPKMWLLLAFDLFRIEFIHSYNINSSVINYLSISLFKFLFFPDIQRKAHILQYGMCSPMASYKTLYIVLFLCFFLLSSYSFPDWLSFTRQAFVSASFRFTSPPAFCAFHPRLFHSFPHPPFLSASLAVPIIWRRNLSAGHLMLYTVNTPWTHISDAGFLISQGIVWNPLYQWFSNYGVNSEISPCVASTKHQNLGACDVTKDNEL